MAVPTPRRTYEESVAELQRLGYLEADEFPPIPGHRPCYGDDEPLGVGFFRAHVTGELSGMTLPRTFFGRSEVCDANFCNTDFSESTLCWCTFVGVNLAGACLRDSDLRASYFERVNFSTCDLRGTDLRMSSFSDCDFSGAMVKGMKLVRSQADQVKLDSMQAGAVDWQSDEGEEPGGG
ncbi:MAG: pentapeptide repeat-containing protein [Phycisphaerales bacterium]